MAETAAIQLRNGKGHVVAIALCDAVDLPFLQGHTWLLRSTGYAYRYQNRKPILMHRALLGLSDHDDIEVDHINSHKLDNRQGNLRLATHAQNSQNRRSARNASSPYRGVYRTSDGTFEAQVRLNNVKHYLGRFSNEMDAAVVAARARQALMPFTVEPVFDKQASDLA
jgi:hypothetical protein